MDTGKYNNKSNFKIYTVARISNSMAMRFITECANSKNKFKGALILLYKIICNPNHKIFVKCLHGTIEREWLKQG